MDPDYLETKIKVTDVNALLADFKEPAADQDRLLLADAIRKSANCLNQDPQQLAGQLLGRIAEEWSLDLPAADTVSARALRAFAPPRLFKASWRTSTTDDCRAH